MLEGLINFSIKQKTIVILLIFGIVGIGLWAYLRLPIEAFPDVLNEYVQVITLAPGQTAEDVEKKITIPLEREFSGIPKIVQQRSISEFGLSVVYLYFDDDVDKYWARSQTMEKIATASIPTGIQPSLAPMSAVTGEVLRYEVRGNGYTSTQLRRIQDWVLEKEFRSVPGVADVVGYGGKVLTWEVAADPLKLATYGVTIRQLADSIQNSNANTGGNLIQWPNQSFVVRSDGEIKNFADLGNVGVIQRGNSIIRVGDLSAVSESHASVRGVVGRDDHDEIVQGILLLRKGENPVTVGNAIREKIISLNKSTILPEGVHLATYYDRLELVKKTTKTVGKNLLEGLILVALILFLFLGNFRATLLVTLVVPLSLLFAFALMVLTHTPANLISLGAIDFGIIVDGAVLIVEYVLMSAKTKGSDVARSAVEVARPVVFSMGMVILAYLPIFTLQAVEGKMFSPLAWTISFALLGALLVSLVIVPSFLPNVIQAQAGHEEPHWLVWARAKYQQTLTKCQQSRRLFLIMVSGVAGLGLVTFMFSGSEFLPALNEGALWIRASFPHSMSVDEGVKLTRKIRDALKTDDEVRTVVSQLGGPEDGTDPNLFDNCEFFVDLKPKESWSRFHGEREELVGFIRKQLQQFIGVDFNVSQPIADNVEEAIAGVKGKNAVKIYGPDLTVLNEISEDLMREIRGVRGTTDVSPVSVMPMIPQLTVRVDRAKVAQAGLVMQDVNDLVEIAVGGKVATQVYDGETRIDVVVRAPEVYRSSLLDIFNLPIPLPGGAKTHLGALATVRMEPSPQVVNRENGYRRIAVKFDTEGRDLGSAMQEILEKTAKIKIPSGYFIEWGGEYQNQKRAMHRLMIVLPATIVLLGVVLFILFSDLYAVSAVIMTLHLSMVGSILLLFVRGIPFSVSAAVGLLALFGVVTLNGVALTSSALEKRKQGLPIWAACEERFRPILMTSVLAALGLLPAAISHGIGSETQKPLATAVIGGIFTSIPAVLLFLPIILNMFWSQNLSKKERK